ncbi:helix-turn-helix domain-containing protein [Mycolicibacter arupensis]|uniref:helix-turn-helix domain-containing protein n=1 Tax=Mycolicibacter arupensis TaxID=342002 RepID=UPI00122D1880|nr:helix-turn-helix domain-containing protein [Mycolicibacter arupensis]KAA1430090.1 helix-turn-helix domain-containing protein [Mycolicibacter arupensis]
MSKESKPTKAEAIAAALDRVMTAPAVDLVDLSLVMGVAVSTVQRHAVAGDLPVPVARLGQRWIVPTAPLREFLRLEPVSA